MTSGVILRLSEPGDDVCARGSAQEREGNGKVVVVGGGCVPEIRSCPLFCPSTSFPSP